MNDFIRKLIAFLNETTGSKATRELHELKMQELSRLQKERSDIINNACKKPLGLTIVDNIKLEINQLKIDKLIL